MDLDVLKFVSLTALTEVGALWSLKRYAQGGGNELLIAGMAGYAVCGFWLSRALLMREKLGVANSLWNALSNVYGMGLGWLAGEALTNREVMGIAAATVSSFLLV